MIRKASEGAAAWMIGSLIFFILHLGTVQDTTAQHVHPQTTAASDSAVAAFIHEAREASRPYHNLEAAIGAGYRLIGPDLPGMGEHWVHVRLAIQRKFDRARPNVLTYLQIEGERILTGVAFAIPVLPGGSPPDFPFPEAWHYHSGTIDEETLILNPRAMHHGDAEGTRLAMLHAWIWTDNPAGMFEQDNWALPFMRLGLPVPEEVNPQAGKALFLLTGGVEYYAQLIRLAGAPGPEDEAAVGDVLARHYDLVKAVVEPAATAQRVEQADLDRLAALWDALWAAIQHEVSAALWARIQMLAG